MARESFLKDVRKLVRGVEYSEPCAKWPQDAAWTSRHCRGGSKLKETVGVKGGW